MAGEIEEPLRFDFQAGLLHSGSISFGRFESESLSWERRSSFSHNRYLEEVEKYSKPGSVTEKKAYFEAHFKRKALLKQNSSEIQDEKESPTSEHNNDLCENEPFNDMRSEVNDLSITSHATVDKDTDMVIMVRPTSEMKQRKPKLKAHVNDSQVQRTISSETSLKAKIRENKSSQMKEKEKKAPRPSSPITHSVRRTLKTDEPSTSFQKAKILPLNRSFVKEYKSEKRMEIKSSGMQKSLSVQRTKQTTITPSVNHSPKAFTFRSDQRAEKRKEEKRVAEMTQSQKGQNFKATPMPSFYKESTHSSYKKEQFIRPSSSPSLTNKNPLMKSYILEKKKKELSSQKQKEHASTKGARALKNGIKGVDLVNGPKL